MMTMGIQRLLFVALPCLLLFTATFAEVEDCSKKDRMYWLPGYPHPLPSSWYSGYLNYELQGVSIRTHYVYVEAEQSASDQPDTPLIYWTNGGPGASSLFGLMTELGPLLLSDLSLQTKEYQETGIPTPIYNPNSWSKLGSLLIFDAPAPVGFSYCNDDIAGNNGTSCLNWTDELASNNTYQALQSFYQRFPSLKQRPLYLTGESYAGIYVPTLARRILENIDKVPMNIKGFAVGDGCLGTHTEVCGELGVNSWRATYFSILFLAGHGQMPYSDFQQVLKLCHDESDAGINKECQEKLDEVNKEIGGYYAYGLYDDCTYENGLMRKSKNILNNGAVNDYPCGGGPVMESYFTHSVVKDAFHVPPEAIFFSVDNAEAFSYTPTEPDLTGFYRDVVGKKYGKDLRVLVYNGDADPAITSFAAQDWTAGLGLSANQTWRPWTLDGCRRMGGYVTRYEGSFDFLTIRGAGHMVPTNKAEASFTFLKAWIQNKDYPRYDKDCQSPPFASRSASTVAQKN
jgi:carboxypeptidase C (cathepsin A)